MFRLITSLVILLSLSGCIPNADPPIFFRTDFEMTNENRVRIINVAKQVNYELGTLYGGDLLIFDGTSADTDGFQMDDFNDGHQDIYQIMEGSDTYNELLAGIGLDPEIWDWKGSVFFQGDMILINKDKITTSWSDRNVLHEFGHWLGLWHRNDPTSVMHMGGDVGHFSQLDKEAFCIVHDCAISPF